MKHLRYATIHRLFGIPEKDHAALRSQVEMGETDETDSQELPVSRESAVRQEKTESEDLKETP